MSTIQPYAFTDSFSVALLHALINNPKVCLNVCRYLTPKRFTTDSHRVIADAVVVHTKRFERAPARIEIEQTLQAKVAAGGMTNEEMAGAIGVLDEGARGTPVDPMFLIAQVVAEERKSAMWAALESGLKDWRGGDYDGIVKAVGRAAELGKVTQESAPVDYALDLIDRTVRRLTGKDVPRLATGIGPLDSLIKGGLAAGELGCFLGAPKRGKSFALNSVALAGLKAGETVYYASLEMSEDTILDRLDAAVSSTSIDSLKRHATKVERSVADYMVECGGTLRIRQFAPGITTVQNIVDGFSAFRDAGERPGLLVVDYGDLVAGEDKAVRRHEELGEVYTALRRVAVEWKCRCWTACFTADTEIDTPGGPIPIAKISAGQVVYCYDETTQAITLSHVVRQWRARRAAALVEVILDNGAKIRCTPDHLFMRRDGTYATANSLLPGDSLMPLHRKINHYARSIDKRINTTSKRGGWVTESRFIASWLLGRPLVAGEQVHHRDHNHLNDHPSNLQVMSCSEHMREHRRYSNPMNDLDVRARMAESRKGQRMGDSNPMRRPEVIANFMGDKNCQRRPEVAARTAIGVAKHWANMTTAERLRRANAILIGRGLKPKAQLNHKVVSVRKLRIREDVYDLEVAGHHNFVLAAGVVVHNSQAKREALDKEVVTMADVAEGFKKAQIADVLVALCGTEDECKNKIIRMYVAACRYAEGNCTTQSMRTDFANGRIWDETAVMDL